MVSKIWGRNGLDGDFEAREASRGAGPLKKPDTFKLNDNNNVAFAA